MIRLFVYFACVAAIATGLAWIADRPGSLTVEWLGYQIQTSVFIGGIVLLFTFAALVMAGWLGVMTWTAPKRLARSLRARRHRIGQEAIRRGIFAASAGDKIATQRAGAIAKRHVPNEPLALLLEAQSAQLNDDAIGSRQAFERMLDKPEMAEVGLRGLFIEAKKAGELEAAKQFAERALTANPGLSWSATALFDMQCREGDWRGALKTLGLAKQHKHIARSEADKRRALLLTALANELEDTQQGKALAYALEAANLAPRLIPASILAGRILAAQGNVSRATKLLAKAWAIAPHPDLALIYAHARTGDSPRDRLARVKTLTASSAPSLEGDIAVAVAAVEAKEWATARTALEGHLSGTPQARICHMMARIEAGQNRDAGRAREWLAKAARGAPSPMWVAPDGSISSDWQPLSPASGLLGAYEWKIPTSPYTEAMGEVPSEISALDVQDIDAQTLPVVRDLGVAADDAKTGAGPIIEATSVTLKTDNVPKTDNAPKKDAVKAPSPVAAPTVIESEAVAPPIQEEVEKQDRRFTANDSGFKHTQPPAGERPFVAASNGAPSSSTAQPENPFAPRIFVAGRAPDDPGPRETEQATTKSPRSLRRPT